MLAALASLSVLICTGNRTTEICQERQELGCRQTAVGRQEFREGPRPVVRAWEAQRVCPSRCSERELRELEVVFFTGGVWIIGYKMCAACESIFERVPGHQTEPGCVVCLTRRWGMLMGMVLQRLGILLIEPWLVTAVELRTGR